jgi:hypothetical protein
MGNSQRDRTVTTPYANAITKCMFVSTADQNYMLARVAFFDGLDLDFFWLSLHALEKYYKAALLMNGQEAKSYGHNLVELHQALPQARPAAANWTVGRSRGRRAALAP